MTDKANWRTPAMVIGAGSLALMLVLGTRQSFGLYLQPITAAHGWSREVFSFAIAIQVFMWGAMQPFAGAIADKYGSGRVVAAAGLMFASGMVLMAIADTPLVFNIGGGILVGSGVAGAGFSLILAAVARVVPLERRSFAFGICTALGSFGQFAVVPVSQALIGAYGWSAALMVLAAVSLVTLPVAFVLKGKSATGGAGEQSILAALREAGTHPGYWLLTAGYFVCGFHVTFIATHLPAYLVDSGIAPEIGAWALALVGLFNIIGSLYAGVLGGKHRMKYLLSIIYFTRAVVILVFLLVPLSAMSALVFAAGIGLLWLSTVPLTTGLVGQIFGTRYLAMLSGVVFFSHQVGSVLGVWLGGWLYDRTGSYDLVWWISVALGVFAAVVHYPIDDRALARPVPAAA